MKAPTDFSAGRCAAGVACFFGFGFGFGVGLARFGVALGFAAAFRTGAACFGVVVAVDDPPVEVPEDDVVVAGDEDRGGW